MDAQTVYVQGNFWDAGLTDIWDGAEKRIGRLDLQDIFTAGVAVLDLSGNELASGKFRFFSNTWHVTGRDGTEVGQLRARFAFFAEKFEFEHERHGTFSVVSEPFSREYAIENEQGETVASFTRTNGFFAPAAYVLHNRSELPTAEWIVVVMGVHAIEKRRRNSGT
ncbi:hypothetical protein SD70_24150 [Gordoniibacillus kamchatkensis]|uniref:Uncharacterized protein n=1 Tax=Gordoniibacillus kamchatkensis TaxID=1590651 RepID=A0ABR5ACX6_9BACL|nr:hypothetical protein [Paenibacillus sp. VKM B-2647]KIL38810.1 hypothetical protein SD70_24150 [Paenibacillus sp. VKM B-2647]